MSVGTANADFRYLLKLSGISIILQSLGWIVSPFPFFIFFAYVPLMAMCNYVNKSGKSLSMEFTILTSISLVIPSLLKFFIFDVSLISFLAGVSPAAALILWWYSGKVLSSLKSLYVLAFWLGVEYIFITLNPPIFNHIPGATFRLWGEALVYVGLAGFQGTSVWIVLANLLFTNSLLQKDGTLVKKISKPKFFTASAVAVLPMVISMFVYSGSPEGNMSEFFANPAKFMVTFNYNPFYSFYLDNGEYLGKLSFWLSIVLILSLLVRQLRTKNENKN